MIRKGEVYIENEAMDWNTQENRRRERTRTSLGKTEDETRKVGKTRNEVNWTRIQSREGIL
jgi:hypothetical protein